MNTTKEFWEQLVLREKWGAKRRNGWGDRTSYYPLRHCFLHHTVAGEISENATVAEEIAYMHRLEQIGWDRFGGSVSYPLVVFPSGRAYQGLGFSRVGAHTVGYNTAGMAIALPGDYSSKRPTAAQERTIALALEAMKEQGILASARLTGGHRDVFATSCPGATAYGRIGAINSLVGKVGAKPAPKPAKAKPAASKPAAKPASTGSTKPWAPGKGPWPEAYLTVQGDYNQFIGRALNKLLGDIGLTGTLAQRLQKHLKAKGYYTDAITSRSTWGPKTTTALQLFLRDRKFYSGAIDGSRGPQTVRALVTFLNSQADLYFKG